MSFAAGLVGGLASGKEMADARRRAAEAAAAAAARPPRGMAPDQPNLEAGGAPWNRPPLGLPPAPPEPHSSTFDPRRGMFPTETAASTHRAGGGLSALVDEHEGGGRYDTLFSYAQQPGGADAGRFDGIDVSRMTIGELRRFADPSGPYGQWVKGEVGRVATPMGRHQIVGTTLGRTADAMKLSDDTVFSPKVQDAMFDHLASARLASSSSAAGRRAALRAEWEGFKHVSDAELDAAIAYDMKRLGIGRDLTS